MADIITLTCPKCGGKLEITPDIERFACAHCGNEHLVRRGIGVITLAPVVESMDGLRRATDRTASEMAIRRVKEELEAMESAKAEIEARLAQARAKLAEHDQWAKNRRDYKWFLAGGLVLLVGYALTETHVRGGGDPDLRLFCAYPLLGITLILVWLWFTGIWRGNTIEAVKPPAPRSRPRSRGFWPRSRRTTPPGWPGRPSSIITSRSSRPGHRPLPGADEGRVRIRWARTASKPSAMASSPS